MPTNQTSSRGATAITQYVQELSRCQINAYREDPKLVDEHANLERALTQGSYGRRQVYELVQNGADAMVDGSGGRIHILLTDRHLYCANEGAPIDEDGADALLHSHLSVKRRNEIGRFGLGFKSVLGVTRAPEFHSNIGSFGFDADGTAARIREVVPDAELCPTLRIATVLDTERMAAEDPYLAELMSWATTVVRLPRTVTESAWLSQDIKEFPAEFLLFCPHVGSVTLHDVGSDVRRELRIEKAGEEYVLVDGKDTRRWRVFKEIHRPTDEAKKEAGELAYRDELPLIWAVPTEGRAGLGSFWAFFPLGDETTLSGVVNAPWKTNDDRTNLFPGKFNQELLDSVTSMVVENLDRLNTSDDPGRYLDVMPARGREARCWADEYLTGEVYKLAATAACVPDQDGHLQAASDVNLHPPDLPQPALLCWSEQPDRPVNWCHSAVETRERRPRVTRLYESAKCKTASLETWLIALRTSGEPSKSAPCIRVAAALYRETEKDDAPATRLREQISHCVILLDHKRVPERADPEVIFLPGDHDPVTDRVRLVHRDLVNDPGVSADLETLGLTQLTPALELKAVIEYGFDAWKDEQWATLWSLARQVERETAADIMRNKQVHVRTALDGFRPVHEVLLSGPVVPGGGTRDTAVTIDQGYHKSELGLLHDVGAVDRPQRGRGVRKAAVFQEFRADRIQKYYDDLEPGASKPHYEKLHFPKHDFAGPLEPLPRLDEEGRAAFTVALLEAEDTTLEWTLRHDTTTAYPTQRGKSPEEWAIRRYGMLPTSLGPRPLTQAVSPTLKEWKNFFPIASCDKETEERFELVDSLDGLDRAQWVEAMELSCQIVDDHLLGRFYGAAVDHLPDAPKTLQCRVGNSFQQTTPDEITAVAVREELEALQETDAPVILVANRAVAQSLVERWRLKPADHSVRTEIAHIPAGPPIALVDRFPGLQLHIDDKNAQRIELVACKEIRHETITNQGKTATPRDFLRHGNIIYWEDQIGVAALLERIDDALNLSLGPETRDAILLDHDNQERRNLVAQIRERESVPERFLAAVGAEAIRPRLPSGLIAAVEATHGALSDLRLSKLALVVYGVDSLKEYRDELASRGLQPPRRWAGSREARSFVRQLGFPRPYAGFEQAKRAPSLTIDGPTKLPDLHVFQRDIADQIKNTLRADESGRRGLVSLPTGAGKTRITVQALVEFMKERSEDGPLLWVAQSDELCEQAVQAWREVWRWEGDERQLHISRLWAENEATPVDEGAQVVVATIQKLNNCTNDDEYAWLAEAAAVIIDEAHGATTPEYTELLTWQRIDRKGARCPLIGMTATPYRGRSEEQTRRLVNRFGKNRLDTALGDDPYHTLQELEVLAQVNHKVLPGIDVELRDNELAELNKLRNIPSSVKDRVAANTGRNKTLLDHIRQLPRDWPVLLFSASVEHAQTMAALLEMEGTRAAPISAKTAPGARRQYINQFRSGEIQVLTNYGVLTQGFDAPAVHAIYVARPTFSPNLYQQMIGRGLRGPKNGGKKTCLIVNVEDNFAQYGETLAFREFENLWTNESDD